jgi:hypothetical protein
VTLKLLKGLLNLPTLPIHTCIKVQCAAAAELERLNRQAHEFLLEVFIEERSAQQYQHLLLNMFTAESMPSCFVLHLHFSQL